MAIAILWGARTARAQSSSPVIGTNYGTINITYNNNNTYNVTYEGSPPKTVEAPPGMSEATARALIEKMVRQAGANWSVVMEQKLTALRQKDAELLRKFDAGMGELRQQVQRWQDENEKRAAQGKARDADVDARLKILESLMAAALQALAELREREAVAKVDDAKSLEYWFAGRSHLGATLSYETAFERDHAYYAGLAFTYDAALNPGEFFRAASFRAAVFYRGGFSRGGFAAPSGEVIEPHTFVHIGVVGELGPSFRFAFSKRFELLTDVALRFGGVGLSSSSTTMDTDTGVLAVPVRGRLVIRVLPWLGFVGGGGAVYDGFWLRPIWTYSGVGADSKAPSGDGKLLINAEAHVELTI